MVHGKAVVMFRGDDDIPHPRVPGDSDPLAGVKFYGIKIPGCFTVFPQGNFGKTHYLFTDTGDFFSFPGTGQPGVYSPMDEYAEFRVPEPPDTFPGAADLSLRKEFHNNPPLYWANFKTEFLKGPFLFD
jgi:hypothetical protein